MRQITNFEPPQLNLVADVGDPNDFDERRFINLSLLSNTAVQLKDKVPRGPHVKEAISYPRAFTGKDIVSTIHNIICRELSRETGTTPTDRRAAILVARSLQNSLFFMEVEWGSKQLQDSVEDVYMFLDDTEGSSETPIEVTELPTGVVTVLAKCYSPCCDIGLPGSCYAYDCPRKVGLSQLPSIVEAPVRVNREDWSRKVPQKILASLSQNEVMRQTIIRKIIAKEEQYIEDLDLIIEIFINGLRVAQPPVMTPLILEEFIEEVFGNIHDIRDCSHRLLDFLNVRQREEHPIIQRVGDIFLEAATEFRNVYPTYVGHHPLAEKRMKQEIEQNPEFRIFLEKCTRQLCARPGTSSSMRPDLKLYLNRPAEHLQRYPLLLDAVYNETEPDNPDCEYLTAAMKAIQALQDVARLRTFQSAMGKGTTGRWQWHDLVGEDLTKSLGHDEFQRQSNIFELIQTEMIYVRDLENIETMYVRPLRNAEPPIIPPDRLDQFLQDVFHNYEELHSHHRRLVNKLHELQREQHPEIKSVTAAIFDAVLNFREAYMEYIPNYPIAEYRIEDEIGQNEAFKAFFNNTIRHPDAHRLDMKNFINRPIPRLLRYELLLKQILSLTTPYHEDRDDIPAVIEAIKSLGRETEPGVASAKQKVELWRYNSNLVFKAGEHVDMDLLNDQRSLIYTGKLLRQPESGLEWNGWTELFVMLFDNYLVMTKPTEKDGGTKYKVVRRPVPLDLLTPVNFSDSGIQRNTSILRSLRTQNQNGSEQRERSDSASISSRNQETNDSRTVYPCTIHHNGRLGGPYILYAETAAIRADWKRKLDEAIGLRKVVQESNKVFEIESLSVDTFLSPPVNTGPNASAWHDGTFFTGKVTCSVPFNTPDGRGLVAIGCAEGVWIGYRHDSRSLRRVLHLRMVTQCAVLDDFGLFIVLSDKVLYAYHLEALVPTIPGSTNASQTPQRIHSKDVQFFSVGVLHGRTMIIYMKKRGNNDSVFYAVEPVVDKINEPPKASASLFPRKNRADWFRLYKEFTFADAYDLIFLKAKIAVLCAKGFMIMDLMDYRSVTIPQRDHSGHPYLAKRCESSRPLGMFRPSEDEFLLCYDEFGLFVDRHGNSSRSTGIIEWEGTADRVAMHAPYILLFDTRFIEIRQVETGRLVQIIPGTDIRCVWDGRTLDGGAAVVPHGGTEDRMIQEPRVHAVMNLPEPPIHAGIRNVRGAVQHVFELFPTIPLYLPGSLASPSTAPYFPLSFSPPRSPPLRAHHI
ncbi:Dbl domain-containing protein [Crepidotus variabilis]|uniref:Dbl domain-containing protein n=1 Tax=Crepidotus variabilis TaxID=179855 RepID=A0A9P6JM55_9AGAR|nr:Dbl domain-containing protein [Crepidotus variabilis]